MPQTFSVALSEHPASSDASLHQEIHRHTANAAATDRIIRSISRFGSDPSILRFEVIPVTQSRTARFDASAAWTVRAVRLEKAPPDSGTDDLGA